MTNSLRNAVRLSIATEPPVTAPSPMGGVPRIDTYGQDVFGLKAMRSRLPKPVYARLEQAVHEGQGLYEGDADVVANAMKDWAIEKGATHYTHWFHPMTGLTAEKHDAFLTPAGDGEAINEFSGKTLIKGEPDASSLPSGGIRSTFEARGYTAWDPTSPAFILENERDKTLYIPTLFFSYTGESLDRKTPLLRSLRAVSEQALRVLRLFGNKTATHVAAMVGAEQEYFLVDRRLFTLRPDLVLSGRTVYGFKPAKGQELEDQYFGAINARVLSYMAEVEERLVALGIPARTRHNEVAPGQFELAPVFEATNIAADHNMLVMRVLRTTAERHGFACLLHEKPFAGVNGSGKHNNWSLCDSDGNNLFDPGHTPWDNAQFLVFLAAVMRAVHNHAVALRLGTVGAGNDHRLGACEAPPAIISIFLGERLTRILESVISGRAEASGWEGGSSIRLGVSSMPPLPKDFADRNRTSPFAFTGNKFEFRAVGASQTIAPANTALNAAMACALDDVATELETAVENGTSLSAAVQDLLARLFREHMPIVFNGNGYTAEWQAEAARRGLPNMKDTVSTLVRYNDPEVMATFLRPGVLTERELLARQEILYETYIRHVHVETKVVSSLGRTTILPAALVALERMANLVSSLKSLVEDGQALPEKRLFLKMRGHVTGLMAALDELDARHEELDAMTGTRKRAEASRDVLIPLMRTCRQHADALEEIMDDALWPLPKYGEMLWNHC